MVLSCPAGASPVLTEMDGESEAIHGNYHKKCGVQAQAAEVMSKFYKKVLPLLDVMLAPLVYPAGLLLKSVRKAGVHKLPLCKSALMRVGVFPIYNHYYEPQFDNRNPKPDFSHERNLPGIDWNILGQLNMLRSFTFSQELYRLPKARCPDPMEFYLSNGAFESGDAEYWYQMIRSIKPKRIFEVGSGNSTLMAVKAIRKNHEQDSSYTCEHVCFEPYEMPWLEKVGVTVIRKKVEEMETSFFSQLQANDILFIDSSHIIRPQGDVLFEYLELLPSLNKGVIVHVHDIFSPRNYPKGLLIDQVRFWNEQYLLEAFLSHNGSWSVIGALNFLRHNYYEDFASVAPFLSSDREPGSFYIQKIV
jgi:hypothetical protein